MNHSLLRWVRISISNIRKFLTTNKYAVLALLFFVPFRIVPIDFVDGADKYGKVIPRVSAALAAFCVAGLIAFLDGINAEEVFLQSEEAQLLSLHEGYGPLKRAIAIAERTSFVLALQIVLICSVAAFISLRVVKSILMGSDQTIRAPKLSYHLICWSGVILWYHPVFLAIDWLIRNTDTGNYWFVIAAIYPGDALVVLLVLLYGLSILYRRSVIQIYGADCGLIRPAIGVLIWCAVVSAGLIMSNFGLKHAFGLLGYETPFWQTPTGVIPFL